jgi:hypothetical protein
MLTWDERPSAPVALGYRSVEALERCSGAPKRVGKTTCLGAGSAAISGLDGLRYSRQDFWRICESWRVDEVAVPRTSREPVGIQ